MADDEEVSEHNEDGTPSGMNAPAGHVDLTDAELHDVTEVATVANEFEAIAIVETLEDAGIPAMKHNGIVYLGSSGQSMVVVPRKLLAEARAVVEQFRKAANERGVDEAYKPESVDDQLKDAPSDPLTYKMIEIATRPKEERTELLSPYVAQWLADGMPDPEIARYLASAELNRVDSETLIAFIRVGQSDLLIESLDRRAMSGYALAAFGAFLFVAPFFGATFLFVLLIPFENVIGACLFVSGLGIVAIARTRIEQLEKAKIS